MAALLGTAILAAGCGSATIRTQAQATPATPAVSLTLSTAQTSADGTWATVPMGATGPNLFWQLFRLPATGGRWSLQTPPDIATNGALVLAPRQGTLVTGIRPSLDLTYSPVTATADDGQAWTTLPPDDGLANVPDALAAAPDGHLMALDTDHQISVLSPGGSSWTTLTSQHALGTVSGCGLTALTAVAYTSSGTPLTGGACDQAGVAGIFAYTSGTWQLTGPQIPAPFSGQRIQVIRLTRTGSTDTAVLEAGTGSAASLFAAWSSDNASHWTVSPALKLGGIQPVSVSLGSEGAIAVALSSDRGQLLTGSGASWQPLPVLPLGRAVTLAVTASGITEALAADGSTLTVYKHTTGSASWVKTQVINVPIQYGSSS
ncbi:MAG: hypothetical protein ABSA93_18470 [Streptosporangiaceae bacterium]|jgi:hypothetical protein